MAALSAPLDSTSHLPAVGEPGSASGGRLQRGRSHTHGAAAVYGSAAAGAPLPPLSAPARASVSRGPVRARSGSGGDPRRTAHGTAHVGGRACSPETHRPAVPRQSPRGSPSPRGRSAGTRPTPPSRRLHLSPLWPSPRVERRPAWDPSFTQANSLAASRGHLLPYMQVSSASVAAAAEVLEQASLLSVPSMVGATPKTAAALQRVAAAQARTPSVVVRARDAKRGYLASKGTSTTALDRIPVVDVVAELIAGDNSARMPAARETATVLLAAAESHLLARSPGVVPSGPPVTSAASRRPTTGPYGAGGGGGSGWAGEGGLDDGVADATVGVDGIAVSLDSGDLAPEWLKPMPSTASHGADDWQVHRAHSLPRLLGGRPLSGSLQGGTHRVVQLPSTARLSTAPQLHRAAASTTPLRQGPGGVGAAVPQGMPPHSEGRADATVSGMGWGGGGGGGRGWEGCTAVGRW
jgi:hypothetical protein